MDNIKIERSGIIFVLSSPSGAGKTTVSKELIKTVDHIHYVPSVTTRPKRIKEEHNQDYIFVSPEQFESWVKTGKFLEHVTIFDYLYGTLQESVTKNFANNRDQLLTLNWLGARTIKNLMPDNVVNIFMIPPSKEVLKERLIRRHMDDQRTVDLRLSHCDFDMQHWQRYDYLVINDNLQKCVQDITSIINTERMSCKRINNLF